MSSLAEHLQVLHQHCLSNDEEHVHESVKEVKEIERICSQKLTKTNLVLFCSLIFDERNGLLTFLKKNVTDSKWKDVRAEILSFVSTFVPRIGANVVQYSSYIEKCCIAVYRGDRFSRNKVKALNILMELLSTRGNCCFVDEQLTANLVRMFLEEIASTKSSSTVKCETLHMLGVLARYYPEYMTKSSDRLFEIFLKGLKKEMVTSSKESDLKLIEGYLLGLDSLLFSFTSTLEENSHQCREIFNYAQMSLRPDKELSRYAVPLAGLKLLKDHSSQFGQLLVDNYKSSYQVLRNWFNHKNTQIKHEAHSALDALFQQIAEAISQEDSDSKKSQELFMFFIKEFHSMLSVTETHSKAMSLAVRGYGLFAAPCRRFLSKSDIQHMLSEIMDRCEQLFLSDGEDLSDNKLHQLPSFIQSLASITQQIEIVENASGSGLSEPFMFSMCRLCILLIEKYPKLHRKFHFFCHTSLFTAPHAFSGKPDVMKSFLQKIVYQGLIRSCTYDVLLGEERSSGPNFDPNADQSNAEDILNDARTITYKDYIPLWSNLLCGSSIELQSQGFVDNTFTYETRNEIQKEFGSAFFHAVLKIVERLNLQTIPNKRALEEYDPNPVVIEKWQAENSVDFKIFVNLVDLCWDLFPNLCHPNTPVAKVFQLHFHSILQKLVSYSTSHPTVSGFYKLLATTVKSADELKYFLNSESLSSTFSCSENGASMDWNDGDAEVKKFFLDKDEDLMLLQKFSVEVVSRLQQYKGDLLASCLFYLLSLPTKVVQGILKQLTPAVQRSATVGLSFLPLAESLLNALERWKNLYMVEVSELQLIIPSLQPYLLAEQAENDNAREMLRVNKKTKSTIRKQRNIKEAEEPLQKKIRMRVVNFLGSLGGSVLTVFRTQSDSDKVVAMWDKDLELKYAVPFRDQKPEIRLDLILPRLLEVASQSVNRHAKVSACELLHSIVLYTIGTTAQTTNIRNMAEHIPALYKQTLPVLLKLACDVDQVCKQMFEPLLMQIIHWLTKNLQFENPSTVALLNALMDGLVDKDDSSLRELSAQCINEFLTWSLKQGKSPALNAKSIFKRLYSFALHPASNKRLGASVAFNNLYRVFREQEMLVSDFVLEILVVYIDSLSLAHDDDISSGTQASCLTVLKHIERIVIAKSTILNTQSASRRIPKGFDCSDNITLSTVVDWLFQQSGRPQTECRHLCMRLFYEFVKLLPRDKSSATLWFKSKALEPRYFVSTFETANGNGGIHQKPYMSSLCNKFSVKAACNWFDLVLAALEAYHWVFQKKLLSPTVLDDPQAGSSLFRSVRHFVCDVACLNLAEMARNLKSGVSVFTPQDVAKYNYLKCSVITRILEFFVMLLQNFPQDSPKVIPADQLSRECLLTLVASAAVIPSKLGFDTLNDRRVAESLGDLCVKLMTLIDRLDLGEKRPGEELRDLLGEKLFQNGRLIDCLPAPFNKNPLMIADPLYDLLRSYATLNKAGLLESVCRKRGMESSQLSCDLLECVFNSVVIASDSQQTIATSPSPNDSEMGNRLLGVAFDLGVSSPRLVEYLFSRTRLSSGRLAELSTTHGRYFLSAYSSSICKELCSRFDEYLPAMTEHAHRSPDTCLTLLVSLLEFLASHRPERKRFSSRVCQTLTGSWRRLKLFWDPDSSVKTENTLSNVTDLLRKLLALDLKLCTEASHPDFEQVFEMFSHIVGGVSLKLSSKLQALDLLGHFALNPSESSRVGSLLEQMVASDFPLNSRELTPGSSSFNVFTSAMRKILASLVLSGNIEIFRIVLTLFCREDDHCMSEEIQSAFQDCLKSIDSSSLKPALDLPFDLFMTSQSSSSRRHAVEDVLVPMATQCDSVTLVQFFAAHSAEIMDVIKEESRRIPERTWIAQLERKGLAYRLLELMFSLLPKEQTDASSTVSQAYSSRSLGKESLVKAFMTRATRDRKEHLEGGHQLSDERRKFHCYVYNALIAAVICTQSDQKWYKAFLFDENPSKNQFFLDNVIDTRSRYAFEVEVSEPLKKRKRFVAIRGRVRKSDEVDAQRPVNYMASIAGSSLSEEVSAFDANRASTFHASQQDGDPMETTPVLASSPDTSFHRQGKFVELESNLLDQHECMAPLVALITHMRENNIGLPGEDNPADTDQQLPAWMVPVHRKLSSDSSHPNVRIFIAKLIVNCDAVFRPYAKHWIPPMIRCIIREDCCSSGIDWMACDILATLLSWNSTAIPEDSPEGRGLVQGLLEQLTDKFATDNRPLLRHNLDLIKTALECWGSRVKSGINPKMLFRLCSSDQPDSKANFGGLQLLGALLANGISPFSSRFPDDRRTFFQKVFANMSFKRKEIYDSAAEVAGMTLKHLTRVEKESEGEIHDMVASKLTQLSMDPKRQDIFITCLHKVALHHSPIVEQFLAKVNFLIPKLHGDLLTYCYEIIYQHAENIPDLIVQLRTNDFASKLKIGDQALQLVLLRLCRVIMEGLKAGRTTLADSDALRFVAEISRHFSQHPSATCRLEAAVVMMEVYDWQRRIPTGAQNEAIKSRARLFLLNMLTDQEEALKSQVANFWSGEGRLPADACAKLAGILEQLYEPSLEESAFMSYSISLLLQSSSESPDFERSIFQHPLSDCVFQEYKIDNRWQHRHSSMTPLFVDTQQAGNSPSSPTTQSAGRQPNMVMATQDGLQFTATVDAKGTYNWMTGSTLDTFSSLAAFGEPERRSALISVSQVAKQRPSLSRLRPGPEFGRDRIAYTGPSNFGSAQGIDVDVERLRRRIRKESDDSRLRFARAQERRNKLREAASKEQVMRKENQVHLYRQYRSGELPDIEIPHRSIVAPLAAACQHDPPLSRIVLSSLILSLVQEEKKKTNVKTVETVFGALVKILERSSERNPSLMGCIQDVCYDWSEEGSISASTIATSALAANKQALGIILLEQMILNKERVADEPTSKRRRISSCGFESEPEYRLPLARLYKSLGDFDVLRGIFTGVGASNPATSNGLSLESSGKFKEASKLYKEALNQNAPEVSDVEKDLWEDCLLNCLKNMSRWDHVNKMCDSLLDRDDLADDLNLSLAWSQPSYGERFLDSAVHAKLLLLLQGETAVGNELCRFFDDAMKVDRDDRRSFVERKYPEELAMLYIYKNDHDRARYYLQLASEHATQRWSSVGALARSREQEIYRILPIISDLEEYLDWAKKPDHDVTSNDVRSLVANWMKKLPHVTHEPITSWDDVIRYRSFLLDKMMNRLENLSSRFDSTEDGGSSEDNFSSWIETCRSRMLVEMMRSACAAGNFETANKIMKQLEKDYKSADVDLRVTLLHETAQYYHARARHQAACAGHDGATPSVRLYLAAFRSLQEVTECGSSEVRQHLLLAATYEMTSLSMGCDLAEEDRADIRDMIRSDDGDLGASLRDSAYLLYKKAVKLSEKYEPDSQLAAFDQLSTFCDKQIRKIDNAEQSSTSDAQCLEYAVTMTTCVLRSMRFEGGGRSTATLRFPRLLQFADRFGAKMSAEFLQESQSVPSWLFLAWIGHMVAMLDRATATFVQGIVKRLSEDYPQAVIYPLSAAQDGFDYEKSAMGKKNKSFVKRLVVALHELIPLARDFIGQLQMMCHPFTVFKDWKSNHARLLRDRKSAKPPSQAELLTSYQNMYKELFGHVADSTPQNQSDSSLYGTPATRPVYPVGELRANFAKAFKKNVDQLYGGPAGAALLQIKDFTKQTDALCNKMANEFKQQANSKTGKSLKDYSPWLVNYQSLPSGGSQLEIPGQYHGRSRPLKEYHVTIVGFDERVQVMRSLRRPCRVIIRGSDERDHSFLVKGGEDLRQDQRIEQIFSAINDLLYQNSACRERDLSIITYQVVPINCRLGLIQWVSDVQTFLDVMRRQAQRMGVEGQFFNLMDVVVPKNPVKTYGEIMKLGTYTDVVDAFRLTEEKLPWNMLREVYMRLSASPESFILMRKRFVSSYSVICVVHWLLGIGDRHPSNFMIATTSGRIVEIDFGHAFGSATEVLPVPELVPFRMTRQLANLLLPHSIKRGEFRQFMVHCLSAVRSRFEEVFPLLDVFIKDPSVDWQNLARKSRALETSGHAGDGTSVTPHKAWFAKRKVTIVERKLKGANPAVITCDEVDDNAGIGSYRKYYHAIAKGDRKHGNFRDALGKSAGLSVEDQVDCLLDQATDPNILGRTYSGWKSWL